MWNSSAAHDVVPARTQTIAHRGTIASATSPLNLRKLTMSDFGDVDDRR
jgi:hypothetical protein